MVLLGPLPQAVGRGEDEHRNVDPMIDPPVSETLAPCLGWEKSNHQGWCWSTLLCPILMDAKWTELFEPCFTLRNSLGVGFPRTRKTLGFWWFRCEIFFSYRAVPRYPIVVGYLKLLVGPFLWLASSVELDWVRSQEPLETWKRLEEFWWRLHVEEGKALKGSRKIQQLIQNPSVIQEN